MARPFLRSSCCLALSAAVLAGPVGLPSSVQAAGPEGEAAPAAPAKPTGEPAADALPRARITIDASALGEASDVVASQIETGISDILTRSKLDVVQDASAPEMVITVAPLGGDNPGYRCASVVKLDGQDVANTAALTDCRLCTEGELVEAAQAAVEVQLDVLREHGTVVAEPVVVDDPTGEGGKDKVDVIDPPPPEIEQTRMHKLTKTGIAVGAVGLAALVPGIILAVLPTKPLPDAELRTTTVPGAVLAGVGGAALITGVVLIAIGVKKNKKSTARLLPTFGPRRAGLSLSGRF